jgi:hypothetical protein
MTIRELLKAWKTEAKERGIMDKEFHTACGTSTFLIFVDTEDDESEDVLFMYKEVGKWKKAYITSVNEIDRMMMELGK